MNEMYQAAPELSYYFKYEQALSYVKNLFTTACYRPTRYEYYNLLLLIFYCLNESKSFQPV